MFLHIFKSNTSAARKRFTRQYEFNILNIYLENFLLHFGLPIFLVVYIRMRTDVKLGKLNRLIKNSGGKNHAKTGT